MLLILTCFAAPSLIKFDSKYTLNIILYSLVKLYREILIHEELLHLQYIVLLLVLYKTTWGHWKHMIIIYLPTVGTL